MKKTKKTMLIAAAFAAGITMPACTNTEVRTVYGPPDYLDGSESLTSQIVAVENSTYTETDVLSETNSEVTYNTEYSTVSDEESTTDVIEETNKIIGREDEIPMESQFIQCKYGVPGRNK